MSDDILLCAQVAEQAADGFVQGRVLRRQLRQVRVARHRFQLDHGVECFAQLAEVVGIHGIEVARGSLHRLTPRPVRN